MFTRCVLLEAAGRHPIWLDAHGAALLRALHVPGRLGPPLATLDVRTFFPEDLYARRLHGVGRARIPRSGGRRRKWATR